MTARPQRHPAALETLLEQAGLRGNLAAGDLLEFFPDAALDPGEQDASRDRAADPVYEATPRPDESPGANDDPVSLYLKEMSRVPLLSLEEEFELAARIEKARNARKKLGMQDAQAKVSL